MSQEYSLFLCFTPPTNEEDGAPVFMKTVTISYAQLPLRIAFPYHKGLLFCRSERILSHFEREAMVENYYSFQLPPFNMRNYFSVLAT